LTGFHRAGTLGDVSKLRAIGADVEGALEQVNVPSYVIDSTGVIRWVNAAGRRLVGDVRGRQFTSVVAADYTRRARETFAQKIAGGADVTDSDMILLGGDGHRLAVEVSSVPLHRGGNVIGVFGQLSHVHDAPADAPAHPALTPRQTEILKLLARGYSTKQMAEELHLSTETVRNHVRNILQALGVHSRLEAVAVAHREHVIT
jgi:PAS domain S-box-containing protein